MGVSASLFLIAVGAVLAFAVDAAVEGVDLVTVGWILIALGVVGVLLSLVTWESWGGFGRSAAAGHRRRTVVDDRPAVTTRRRTVVEHDDRLP